MSTVADTTGADAVAMQASVPGNELGVVWATEQLREQPMTTSRTAVRNELTLEDIMADPMTLLIMRRDGVEVRDLRQLILRMRATRRTTGRRAWIGRYPGEPGTSEDRSQHPLCRLSVLCEGVLPLAGAAAALCLLLVLASLFNVAS